MMAPFQNEGCGSLTIHVGFRWDGVATADVHLVNPVSFVQM